MEKMIWTMWWQGEENAPQLVKKCIDSMRINAGYAEIIVLDKENYKEYVQLPIYILEKFNKGIISITHLSDIIRVELIKKYGGLWIDSTIFVAHSIPEELFDYEFYSLKYQNKNDKLVPNKLWTAFLLGGKKNCVIFNRLSEMFNKYWQCEDDLCCYFLIDYCMKIVIEEDECLGLVDNVKQADGDYHLLDNLMDKENLVTGVSLPIFNKLSWKKKYYTNDNSKPTVYTQLFGDCEQAAINAKKQSKINKIFSWVKIDFNNKKIKKYGFKMQLLSFLTRCFWSKEYRFAYYIFDSYHNCVITFLKKKVLGK